MSQDSGISRLKQNPTAGDWYFVEHKDQGVKAIMPAGKVKDLAKIMHCPLGDLRIAKAEWDGKEFKPGKLIKDYENKEGG